ncbi:hypothetical protein [Vibrio salilacus]|uniref:hypothetical protein n=1 Tax=Vibrio salilacus TaxID=1323749 RepID=UPI001FE51E11|nr:hypothetical protein [Vibrio salilacus]
MTIEEIQDLIAKAEAHEFHDDIQALLATLRLLRTKSPIPNTQTKDKKYRSVSIRLELYDMIYKEGSGPLFNIGYSTEILGHSDIKQTMRYAHLAPVHLEDVVSKNYWRIYR